MKRKKGVSFELMMFVCVPAAVFGLFSVNAHGAEGTIFTRRLWNDIMLFVNFGILVVLFLRYGRKPLMNYLRRVREHIEDDMERIHGRYQDARSLMEKEAEKLNSLEQDLRETEESILEMGRREREKIIEEGRIFGEKMLKDAERYARHRLAAVRRQIQKEMVDLAIVKAKAELENLISEKDDERLIEQFIAELKAHKHHLGSN